MIALTISEDSGLWTLLAVVPAALIVGLLLYRWAAPRVAGWVEGPKQ